MAQRPPEEKTPPTDNPGIPAHAPSRPGPRLAPPTGDAPPTAPRTPMKPAAHPAPPPEPPTRRWGWIPFAVGLALVLLVGLALFAAPDYIDEDVPPETTEAPTTAPS
ncbi:MAG TPA: hypothetical protein RMH85_32560 [Polyangiaceae bacterium LLY-WYZ-15_(1-7)]|nr:hypothetical protein [Myxococcales bacterium]MBJ69823.1 hypothetical protein [Sandaracinus sp.]HJK89468.1 hypothetical protein [Polyangiaceae bacterium LLY-WYZ-15_(1-7)]HJL02180.1 hypothetical protein [Polyangiaceae bacterium LLY-WYZ-15_(1-7)]HJL13260.1 hypothetical protein [Polyangiaceae bacterium LLY-WYZ-15_(1-7)]